MAWTYHNPVAVTFGDGSLDRLGAILGRRRAVLVAFPEAEALGHVASVRRVLGDALAGIIDDIEPNPDVVHLRELHARFWREFASVDAIVALGGGSTLDTAKVLAVTPPAGDFDALVAKLAVAEPFVPARAKALVAIPTTAGTGSEVTPWATVWDRGTGRKYSLHLRETWPEAAIVDPRLTASAPRSITLQSGLDALSHALEAIWNVNANDVSDTLAVSAARRMQRTLPALVEHLDEAPLREQAALAALEAGLAFSNTRTALAHSISYEMTLRHGLPHGIACSFTLPLVLERARGCRPDRDAVLARVFDVPLARAAGHLASWLESLGVSTAFETYGVGADESRAMVDTALTGARGRNFIGATAG
ncbi:MAG TPA: iron-containing alcohol dehydrogenase PsrA [Casimicrobiaceae bacterium]|nr:iron-containing alcohol dehydrogenase PsrA [Casimicrobiaceae bacterium]